MKKILVQLVFNPYLTMISGRKNPISYIPESPLELDGSFFWQAPAPLRKIIKNASKFGGKEEKTFFNLCTIHFSIQILVNRIHHYEYIFLKRTFKDFATFLYKRKNKTLCKKYKMCVHLLHIFDEKVFYLF